MVVKGADVEALSPRDANARPRPVELKSKAVAQLKANKDKEHPPPPPPNVSEPSSADCREGNIYQVVEAAGQGRLRHLLRGPDRGHEEEMRPEDCEAADAGKDGSKGKIRPVAVSVWTLQR